jgi:hypothetical protein
MTYDELAIGYLLRGEKAGTFALNASGRLQVELGLRCPECAGTVDIEDNRKTGSEAGFRCPCGNEWGPGTEV